MSSSDLYDFKLITEGIWEATAIEWANCWAESGDQEADFSAGIINRANPKNWSSEVQPNGNKYVCYAVTSKNEDCALAIVEIVHSKSLKQTRILKVNILPSLEQSAAPSNRDKIDQISWIISAALLGALELTMESVHSTTLKIWLSFPMTTAFLRNSLQQVGFSNLDVAGNWLIITLKSKS